jgi:hypothetical protein
VSGESVFGLFACAIGVALLVVTLAIPTTERIVKVQREPIYVRVQESPWVPMPELTSAGIGHPVEPR